MRSTHHLFRGLLGRSLDELYRRSTIALQLQGIKGPSPTRLLYDFSIPSAADACVLMSDGLIGGQSTSLLTPEPNHARFHGHIRTSLPQRPDAFRSGYAAFRTPDQSPTLFGRSVWDVDPWTYLALRIKSDGRAYFVNVQTETVEPSDLHQHRLFANRVGEWETVMIKWSDFVRTNHGFVVEPQAEMLRQRVTTVGIGLTDRREGPFEICVGRMWATNEVPEGATVVEGGTGLRSKSGEPIRWS